MSGHALAPPIAERRVLIVDDERDFALSLADILESRGYAPALAHDAASARLRQAEFRAAVAFVDVRLAGGSGFDLLAGLREDDPALLCVMMTAYADVESAVRALHNGAYDFLRKPFSGEELLATLARCFAHVRLDHDKRAAEEALRQRNAELAEVNQRLRMMVESAGRLPHCTEIGELSRRLLSDFSRLMAAEGGSLYVCEPDTLRLAATVDGEHAPRSIPLPLPPTSILGHVLHAREPLLVRDLDRESRLSPSGWGGYRDGSLIVFPILRGHEVLALVSLHNKTWPPFTAQDRDLGRVMISLAAEVLKAQQAHLAVRESERRYRSLFESAGDGILILKDGRFVDANQRAADLLGSSPSALVGQTPWDLSPETQPDGRASRDAALDHLARAATGTESLFEWRHRRADGIEIEAEVALTRVELGGEPHVQAIVRDVTQRKQTQAQLTRLATAVEHADEDIIITDPAGVIVYVNPAFERITGYSRQEAVGATPRLLKSGAQDRQFYSELWQTLGRGHTWLGRFTNRRKDGGLILEDASISPILGENGRLEGFVSVKRDVTRQVELERHLARAQRIDAIGTLAGGIAHDFNNILSSILGSVDLARAAVGPEAKVARHLGNIGLAARRAAELTRQILAFSRRGPQDRRPLALATVVEEALNLVRASLPGNVEIRRRIRATRAVEADATQIHQVLMNLATNAGLAMRDRGGILEVRLEDVEVPPEGVGGPPGLAPGPYVRLVVTDTGEGMSPEVLAHAFEPFFTTRPPGEGTGMGLAVVHGIVKNHGGTVHTVSQPGEGTTFEIHFPALETTAVTAPVASEQPPRGEERILLVDDEEFHRNITEELLRELGYRVTCCSDGREALDRLLEQPNAFDLVLSDTAMPRLAGDALVAEMERAGLAVPVILCAGFGDPHPGDRANARGARRILLKPVGLWDLAIALRQVLEAPGSRSASA